MHIDTDQSVITRIMSHHLHTSTYIHIYIHHTLKNMRFVDVLAVPSAPTTKTAFFCLCKFCNKKLARVESMVGTNRFEKSSFSDCG